MGVHVDFELDGELGEHVAAVTDGGGWYASVEEYVRDLIRRDVEREWRDFEAFRTELQDASAAPESTYVSINAEEFLSRMKTEAE